MKNNFDIIILAAGVGKRMKCYGPKCLIKVLNDTILWRQIKIFQKIFPLSQIKVISGFKHNKVVKYVNHINDNSPINSLEVNVYESKNYLTEGSSQGILSIKDKNKGCLIVHGDLVFSDNIFAETFTDSGIIVSGDYIGKKEVGFSDIDGYVGRFAYTFPEKWGQIIYLTKEYSNIFCDIAKQDKNKRLLNFEIFNKMIDENGLMLKCYRPQNSKIFDIDKNTDIAKVNKLA